jgi:hypothetical protein
VKLDVYRQGHKTWKKNASCGIIKDLENGDLYLKNNPQKLALSKKTV